MSAIDDARLQGANAFTESEHSAAQTLALIAIAEELRTANLIAWFHTDALAGDPDVLAGAIDYRLREDPK